MGLTPPRVTTVDAPRWRLGEPHRLFQRIHPGLVPSRSYIRSIRQGQPSTRIAMDLQASHETVMAALEALENLQADELWLELPQDVRQHLSCSHAILSALSENDYY